MSKISELLKKIKLIHFGDDKPGGPVIARPDPIKPVNPTNPVPVPKPIKPPTEDK